MSDRMVQSRDVERQPIVSGLRKGADVNATEAGEKRLLFFDWMRNIAMLSVVLYHAVAAYSSVTPHWSVHDGTSLIADGIRHLFDVFMMPIFFFIAGFFAVLSLRRQRAGAFLSRKLRRIGIPWAIGILIIVPLAGYGDYFRAQQGSGAMSFGRFWLEYVQQAGSFQLGLWMPGRTNQMHFWFLSLLLAFFAGLCLIRTVKGSIVRSQPESRRVPPASSRSILSALVITAAATSIAYFSVLLFVPDMSWVTIDLLFQFQPGGLVVYVAAFALGWLAGSRRWFEGKAFPGRPSFWIGSVVLLTGLFFLTGREVFANPSTSHMLSPVVLFLFSVTRTALCLAILGLLLAFFSARGNRPYLPNRILASNSYNIYLVHIFFVVFIQHVLMIWQGGPAMAKVVIVFLTVLPISYGISRLIARFPRSFVFAFVGLFVALLLFAG